MHPVLLSFGSIAIHTYGFFIAIGFLVALSVIKNLSLRSQMNVDRTLDLAFWCLLVGFVGCRLLFVLTRLDTYLHDPLSIFKVWEGGLVFFGGPIAAIPFFIWYTRKHHLNVWKALDVCAIGLVVAHAFGRLGCFSAGCCYGKPTEGPFGVRFYSDLVDKHYHGIPLHPTQLYESFALFALFTGLLIIYKRRSFDGQAVLTYFLIYPLIRSVIEIFRGDVIRGFVIEDILSTSQFISILIFLIAGGALYYRLSQISGKSKFKSKLGGKKAELQI